MTVEHFFGLTGVFLGLVAVGIAPVEQEAVGFVKQQRSL